MITQREQKFYEFTGFLVFFYLIPIVLLYLGYLPFWSRHLIMITVGIVLVAYAVNQGIDSRKIGLSGQGLRESVRTNLIFSALFTALVIGLVWFRVIAPVGYDGGLWFFLFYVLISAPIQEFMFRSLMFYELDIFIKHHVGLKIVFSALIYSLAHAMYQNWLVLLGTFVLGLVWGGIYSRHRNFWGVAISHAIIGLVTIFLGLV